MPEELPSRFNLADPQMGEILFGIEIHGAGLDPAYKRLFAFQDALRQAFEADRLADVISLLENGLPTLSEPASDSVFRYTIPIYLTVERFTPALERAVAAAYAGRRSYLFQDGAWVLANRVGWLARECKEGEAGVTRALAVLDALLFETPPPPLEFGRNDETPPTDLLLEVLRKVLPAWSPRICEEVYHRFQRNELRVAADPTQYVNFRVLRILLEHVAGVRTLPASGYRMLLSYRDVRVDEAV